MFDAIANMESLNDSLSQHIEFYGDEQFVFFESTFGQNHHSQTTVDGHFNGGIFTTNDGGFELTL